MLIALQGAVSQGVLWGIMVLGVFITFRLLDIPDMTCDGSFALGGCVCATLVVAHGMNPVLALILATLAGMIAGAVTGFLHTAFDIPAIFIRYFDSDCPLVHQPSDYGEKQHSTVKDKNNFFRFC